MGYNPRTKILFVTFDVKSSFSYGGDLSDSGTTEYVRFYANFGSGWKDAGAGAIDVHDIPTDKDCAPMAAPSTWPSGQTLRTPVGGAM